MFRIRHQLPSMLSAMRGANRRIHQQNSLHSDGPQRQKFLQRCQRRFLARLGQPFKIHGRQRRRFHYHVPWQTHDSFFYDRRFLHFDHLCQQYPEKRIGTYLLANRN